MSGWQETIITIIRKGQNKKAPFVLGSQTSLAKIIHFVYNLKICPVLQLRDKTFRATSKTQYWVKHNTYCLHFELSLQYRLGKFEVVVLDMKKDIHPQYYPKAKIKCSCGNEFTVGATKEYMEVEICSACHPFYTGKEKMIDTAGRVEKFRERLARKQTPKPAKIREKKAK